MKNFQFKNPTKIIFGKDTIPKLSKELPKSAKIMMLYGGGSIKRNGIYEQVKSALEGFEVIEFGGIPANPEYDILMKALEIIKKENVTYLLAVGGGSVIDGVKFISAAAYYEGDDPWDILVKSIRTYKGMPFGTVLTLPATGSEMNSGSVITRISIKEKRTMGGPGLFPQFSILDPQVVHSIPKRQLANGIFDAYSHVLEQYMTYPSGAFLPPDQDSLQNQFKRKLRQGFKIEFNNLFQLKYGDEASFSSMFTYEAMHILAKAIDNADSLTTNSIKTALLNLGGYKPLNDEIMFNEFGDIERKTEQYL